MEYMPIHPNDIKLPNCPQQIPMSLLSESRARQNHGQSLSRLAERGGLGVKEALSIINDKPWSYYENMPIVFAIAELNRITEQQQ